MSDIAIKVENLGKLYRLGEVSTGTLSQDLKRWWAVTRGKEDPFAKVGETNDRTQKGESDYVWALKDVSFEVKEGEVLGIIGRNGAGKSTLLKLLSKVTQPTTGNIKIKGRIASLLEVGTGFHPDLTGRENVFLNGAILGMTRREIQKKFDEIVDFAGVERYIDTPVKRYSSGMYVRLAFAVAAFLEPEILIIDEVLAVGDAEFQKKCLGRMKDVSVNDGRTVLFVSHNMAAIQKLCTRGAFFSSGRLDLTGNIDHIVNTYLQYSDPASSVYDISVPENIDEMPVFASRVQIEDIEGSLITEVPVGKPWQVRVYFTVKKPIKHFIIALGIANSIDVNIRTTWSHHIDLDAGQHEALFQEQKLLFGVGQYNFTIGLSSYERTIQYLENIARITISDSIDESLDKTIVRTSGVGLLLNPMNITISAL